MWDVNGLIIHIFRQWWEDVYRWQGESSIYLEMFLLLQETALFFNNKWIRPAISIEAVIICSAGTLLQQAKPKCARVHIHTQTTTHKYTRALPSPNVGASFCEAKKQTLRRGGGFVLPVTTGEEKQNLRNNCIFFHLYCSENLPLRLLSGYPSALRRTHMVYCRRGR